MKRKIIILCYLLVSLYINAQQLYTDNKLIDEAFQLAVETLYKNSPDSLIKAGGKYGGEWTRDASINSWNAAALLIPEKDAYSLWSVTTQNHTMIGHQYWDQILWVIAAYDYYEKNNDLAFLRKAYIASSNTMLKLEKTAWDPVYGLFTGPSVFNDGISGYEEPVYNDTIKGGDNVLLYPESKRIKCLSTNCVYYEAYIVLSKMAVALGDNPKHSFYLDKATKLKQNIRKYFYDKRKERLYYLIDGYGKIHQFQECLGNAFAILFGIVNLKEARNIARNVYIGKYGIPSIYPSFKRFNDQKPGRHNVMLWPFAGAFWADACHHIGFKDLFWKELYSQAEMAVELNGHCFYELYDMNTGKQDGGWQNGVHYLSVNDQTWSATGFLRMIMNDVVGMNFTVDGFRLNPDVALLNKLGFHSLMGIRYQKSRLDIEVKNCGNKIKRMEVNGIVYGLHKAIKPGEGKLHIVLYLTH